MSVQITHVSTVVRGRFNPYIITPQWLNEQGIITDQAKQMDYAISPGDLGLRFEMGRFTWQVNSTALAADSAPDQNPGHVVILVLERLPHTPITALGHNFHFECLRSDWAAPLPTLGDRGFDQFNQQMPLRSLDWHAVFTPATDKLLGIKITQDRQLVKIHINHHYEVRGAALASECAQRFLSDFDESKQLLESVFGVNAR